MKLKPHHKKAIELAMIRANEQLGSERFTIQPYKGERWAWALTVNR